MKAGQISEVLTELRPYTEPDSVPDTESPVRRYYTRSLRDMKMVLDSSVNYIEEKLSMNNAPAC
ncbi:MAG: hypothetical protein BWK80_32945 [Desulfobacteraceae bacterium IS3]|nr:MAG: hypothetical protein BWK80_32945 [Desulfobacteraceae bacterium IS3]